MLDPGGPFFQINVVKIANKSHDNVINQFGQWSAPALCTPAIICPLKKNVYKIFLKYIFGENLPSKISTRS